MAVFDEAHRKVYLPDDRRMVFILRRRYIIWVVIIVAVPILLAWLQLLLFGIHSASTPVSGITASAPNGEPRGFPVWIRWTHFANLFFLFLLMRSGVSILMDHPRLYWNNDCTPGTEWLRLTPLKVPRDRVWTAKDDARYVSPLVALPGYRHTIGMGRSWHFITDYGFIVVGLIYVGMLFVNGQWPRLVPTSWAILPDAWQTLVHYATFHFPIEPDGYYAYNALQQLSYFGVVFVMAPLSILTGISMSPAVDNAFPCGYLAFTIVHVALVFSTGMRRNFNHIVLGTDDAHSLGLILGCVGLAAVVVSWVLAYVIAWRYPRLIQRTHKMLVFSTRTPGRRIRSFQPSRTLHAGGRFAVLLGQRHDAGFR